MEHTIIHKDELLYAIDSAITALEAKKHFVQEMKDVKIVRFYNKYGSNCERSTIRQYRKENEELKDLTEMRFAGFPVKMFGCWLLRPRKNRKGATK